MAIHKTARFQVKAEALERCKAAIADFIAAVAATEPGTQLYLSLQEQADPTRFLHYFIFEDAAAEAHHRTTDAVVKFTGILYPELVSDGVEFLDYHLAATTDARREGT